MQLLELRCEDGTFDFQIKGTRYSENIVTCVLQFYLYYRDSLVVQFLIAPDIIALLPDKALQAGKLIPVVPVLFTQGVNEKQTLAHIKHE